MDEKPDQQKNNRTIRYYNKISPLYESVYNSYLQHTHSKFLSRVQILPADHVLDISCGTGLLEKLMLEKRIHCSEWVLNDPASDMLAKAKERLKDHSNIKFTNYYAEELDFPDHSFDKIICLNSFHYYTNQSLVLKHINRFLKPGGTLCIQDWNRAGMFILVNKLIDLISPENINTRTISDMKKLLAQNHFILRDKHTWGYRWWKFFYLETFAPKH